MSEVHTGLDDEIVIKTTLRKLLRAQKGRPGDVEVVNFAHMERVAIRWRAAVQISTHDFRLALAAFNLTG